MKPEGWKTIRGEELIRDLDFVREVTGGREKAVVFFDRIPGFAEGELKATFQDGAFGREPDNPVNPVQIATKVR